MPPGVAALGERALVRVAASPRVLDVGCGPGRDMAWFEERGATVVGTDVSPRMLELARRRCSGALELMDMRELAFPAASFDLVWANASLLHLPKADAVRALEEFRRVVAPGGLVVVTVKRGAGERWEQAGEAPRRLFARYEPDELRAALGGADLEVELLEMKTSERGEDWLHAVGRRAQAS
ncbi:MAG TPA: class I SAM-dependent methyltransferase [Gaiellaceae bacterium]|nr:class I SAM-dependent methyltransferase [Gaiellaceae bacterium]